jgi:hypothetical protein
LVALRRAVVLILLAGLAVATTAVAQGGGDVGAPIVRSAAVLHLEGTRDCRGTDRMTLRVTPPAAVQLGWLSVRLNGAEIVRLTGVAGGASVTIRLPQGGGRVGTSAETLDGQRLAQGRRYRSCLPPPPQPAQPRRGRPPVVVGGGEA